MIRSVFNFFCSKVLPFFVLVIAVFLGWLGRAEIPEGRFFATLVPVMKGHLPPTIVGHGKMKGTPLVPADMQPEPRPEGELLVQLAGGYEMPQNGIGMCCRPTAYDDELVKRTVLWYLLQGGRLIDGAHLYLNHKAIGEGMREAIQRGVPREEIFVTTKIFPSHFGYNTTKEIVPTYLQDLGLEYVDLILMHMPVRFLPTKSPLFGECKREGLDNKQCRQETFRALSELREQGLVRSVGVSNFAVNHLQDVVNMESAAPVAVNQIPYNPWAPKAWVETYEYCQEHNIVVNAYNSLGGFLQHSAAQTVNTLNDLSAKYDKRVAQIMLRWAIQKGMVVIPGTGNPAHMKENLAVYSFELTDEEMNMIDSLGSDESAKEFFSMEPMTY